MILYNRRISKKLKIQNNTVVLTYKPSKKLAYYS